MPRVRPNAIVIDKSYTSYNAISNVIAQYHESCIVTNGLNAHKHVGVPFGVRSLLSRVETVEVLDLEEENVKVYRNTNILKEKDKKLVDPTTIVYYFI